ncbi:unnamed protein product [Lampetra fluviatilis]
MQNGGTGVTSVPYSNKFLGSIPDSDNFLSPWPGAVTPRVFERAALRAVRELFRGAGSRLKAALSPRLPVASLWRNGQARWTSNPEVPVGWELNPVFALHSILLRQSLQARPLDVMPRPLKHHLFRHNSSLPPPCLSPSLPPPRLPPSLPHHHDKEVGN